MQTRTTRATTKLDKATSRVSPLEELKSEEIVGVNVLSLNEMPENPLGKRKQATEQEEEGKKKEQMALPDPKKKQTLKKASTHRDEGAFLTYIFRVHKRVCPDSAITKKAMITLNHLIADKFE